MKLEPLPYDLTICKLKDLTQIKLNEEEICFLGITDQELSLVCRSEITPGNTLERDDGWKGFRIQGVLDFSLIGVLSRLSGILAENHIGIFAVSTYNTDYILVKKENYEKAIQALTEAGFL